MQEAVSRFHSAAAVEVDPDENAHDTGEKDQKLKD
jgi:hypothetical protein